MVKILYLGLCLTLFSSNHSVQSGSSPLKVHTVEIKRMEFVPANIQVKKGDIIIWINRDLVAHNVTEEKRKAWSSSLIPVGHSWKMVVKESSTYYCILHPVMKGKIQVQ